jgi:hypothetical protein
MYLFYRISKQKKKLLPGATKSRCLQNFLEIFGRENLTIVAENCDADTEQFIENQMLTYEPTDLSYCLEQAAQTNGTVYFVEDCYIHRTPAQLLLTEGLTLAPYVTLYDAPEKYGPEATDGEISKVMRTESCHWRYTESTGGSFATTGEVLREDWDILSNWGSNPNYALWPALREKERELAVCIPGAASDISQVEQVEDWAIDHMIYELIDRMLLIDQRMAPMILNFQRQYPDEKMKLLSIIQSLENEVQKKVVKVSLNITV